MKPKRPKLRRGINGPAPIWSADGIGGFGRSMPEAEKAKPRRAMLRGGSGLPGSALWKASNRNPSCVKLLASRSRPACAYSDEGRDAPQVAPYVEKRRPDFATALTKEVGPKLE